MSIVLGDTVVSTIRIKGKDLRDGDVIIVPTVPDTYGPVEVTRVILRDLYGVTFQGRYITRRGDTVRSGIGHCVRIGNLIGLTVERAL